MTKSEGPVLYKHANEVSIGQFYRYTISLKVKKSQLSSGFLPEQLHIKVKNTEVPVKKLFYIFGPYTIYTHILPNNFNELISLNPDPEDESIIQLNPNLQAGNSFDGVLKLNKNSLVNREVYSSLSEPSPPPTQSHLSDGLEILNENTSSEAEASETVEYRWRLDVLSQALLSDFVKVSFEVSISSDVTQDPDSTDSSTSSSIAENGSNSNSSSGPLRGFLPRTMLPSASNQSSSIQSASNQSAFKPSVFQCEDLKVDIESCGDIWNKSPPKPDQPVHLVILTHGVYSNTGCDLLYLKEKLEHGNKFGDNIMIRGYHGNVANTEKGIKWLGVNLANYVDELINLPKFNIDKISFIGHSLGGVVQSFAIYYLLNYDGYKNRDTVEDRASAATENGNGIMAPERKLLKDIQPINFITLASPLLGTQSEFANLINLGLEIGSLGKTGKDLSLRNRYFSSFSLRVDEKTKHLLLKPLLEIMPLDLKFHYYLRSFKYRTVFANVLNDGIVPLKTSALLYLDYQSLSIVERLKVISKSHQSEDAKSLAQQKEAALLKQQQRSNSGSIDEHTAADHSYQSASSSEHKKEEPEARHENLVDKKNNKPKGNVGEIPEEGSKEHDKKHHLSELPYDKTKLTKDKYTPNKGHMQAPGSKPLFSNTSESTLENEKKQNRKGFSPSLPHAASLASIIPKNNGNKLTKRQRQIQRIQTVSNKNNFSLMDGLHKAVAGEDRQEQSDSDLPVRESSPGILKEAVRGSNTDGILSQNDELNSKIYAPPRSSSVLSAINVLLAPSPKKEFFKNYKPVEQKEIQGLLDKMQLHFMLDDTDKNADLEGQPSNISFSPDMIDNGVIVHDKVYTYDELPQPYLNKVGTSRRLKLAYHNVSSARAKSRRNSDGSDGSDVSQKLFKLSDLTDDILSSGNKDIPFLYRSKKSNLLTKKHFKSKQLAEKIARLYHFGKSWRKILVNLKPDAHNNIIVRRQFVNSYGWNVINYLVSNFDYEGSLSEQDIQNSALCKSNIDKLENVHYDASISPLGGGFKSLLRASADQDGEEEEWEDMHEDAADNTTSSNSEPSKDSSQEAVRKM